MFLLMKFNVNTVIVFQYFLVIFGDFLTFWKNFEIQDGSCLDIMTKLSLDMTSASHVQYTKR